SNTIRIGTAGTQTATFIAGIRGAATGIANAVPVLIDSNGQLGTVSSSRRFKEHIRPMAATSSKLMQLRPVTFRYKRQLDPSGSTQYGLIAEDVEKVMPELVARDRNEKIETVKYQMLVPMLLNELQKAHRHIEVQDERIAVLEQQTQEISAL